MDADGFAIELFSAEFGPDEGKDNAHKKIGSTESEAAEARATAGAATRAER